MNSLSSSSLLSLRYSIIGLVLIGDIILKKIQPNLNIKMFALARVQRSQFLMQRIVFFWELVERIFYVKLLFKRRYYKRSLRALNDMVHEV